MPKVQEGGTYSKKYTEDDLQKALKAVANGVGIREAAKRYKVPRATLQFRRSDKFTKTSLGPCPYLTFEEENLLVDWLIESSKRGFPRRKYDLQLSVKSFLDKVPRDNPFTDNFPSDGWNKAFLKRHPDISIRTPEGVSSSSSKVSEKDIRKWFENIKSYLVSKGFDNILNDPSRIFNSDETGFNLCPKNSTVLAPRGSKNVYEVDHASPKQNITVLFTFSADGKVTPPMIIFPGKRLRTELYESVPETWGVGQSDTGWMKAELFNDYIVKVFHPYLISNNITLPVILYIDGHASHLTYEVSELCKTRDIILICLYPNSTRILQPADVAAFKPIKTGWKKGVLKWRREHLTKTLKKEDVAPILETVINDYAKSKTVKNGFRATGLYPFDAKAIDFSKCLGGVVNVATEEHHRNNDNIADQTTITYEIFKNTVGYEKILQFVNEKPNENTSDFIFFKLWKNFQEAGQNKKIEEINEQNDFENSVDQQGERNQDSENNEKDNNDTKEKQATENFMPERSTDQALPSQDICSIEFDEIPIIFVEDLPIEKVIVEEVSSFDEKEKKNETKEPEENDKDQLQQILTLPTTPIRTGKRSNEKTSFVITGTVWRELKQKEEEKKVMKELEKQERNKQRIQRVNEKAEKMKEQNKKKLENLEKKKTAKVKNTKNKNSKLNEKTNQETKTRTTETEKNGNLDDFQNNASVLPLKSIPPDNVQSASKNLFGGVRIISDSTVKQQETDKKDLDKILLELGLSQSLNVKLYSVKENTNGRPQPLLQEPHYGARPQPYNPFPSDPHRYEDLSSTAIAPGGYPHDAPPFGPGAVAAAAAADVFRKGGAPPPSAAAPDFRAAGEPPRATPFQQPGAVLMVYGLDPLRTNADKLFNLMCLYGNVARIKFLKSKEGTAMVQLGDSVAVERCVQNLNNVSVGLTGAAPLVHGSKENQNNNENEKTKEHKLQLAFSKQPYLSEVTNPYPLPDKSPSYKEYLNNKNNRFMNPAMASKNRIQPPSKILHFFNTPPQVTEAELIQVFKDYDVVPPKAVKLFPMKSERSSSGLLEFENTTEAVAAVMACNHAAIESPGTKFPFIMKLCFSSSRSMTIRNGDNANESSSVKDDSMGSN